MKRDNKLCTHEHGAIESMRLRGDPDGCDCRTPSGLCYACEPRGDEGTERDVIAAGKARADAEIARWTKHPHGPVHSRLPEYLAGCGCPRCVAHDQAVGVPELVEWLRREPVLDGAKRYAHNLATKPPCTACKGECVTGGFDCLHCRSNGWEPGT